MKTIQGLTALLCIAAGAAMFGGGCAATEEELAIDDRGDAAVTATEQPQRRGGTGGFGGGGGGGGGGNACAWLEDGSYCGGNEYPGNPNVLYRCRRGYLYDTEACFNGCHARPPGYPDYCY